MLRISSNSLAFLQQYDKPRCKYEWYANEEEYTNINYGNDEAETMRCADVERPKMRLQEFKKE